MPAYPMTSRPRGICLIISNQHFDKPELRKRDGNEQDVENLKRTFENLHFVVEIRQDKTASEMYTIAREFSSIDHSAYDLFVCCILSHGMLGSIYGSDSNLIEINEISSQFKGNACPTLAHKPKLFFIQACRGQDFDRGIQADATRDMDASDAVRQNAEPNESHFLLGYATPPGYVSWRSQVHGSWYISFLCEVLSTYCERYDLVTMMVKVNDKVSEAFTRKGYKQCPAPVVTLRKRIYLNEN
ncbi:predicted protein [Nematostella vectensis]|uniref:Uncharacterized protein n=1 Tax=Nematostella vectensis TaxID=45351 RepID=A7SPA7_NEMVE|nr:predicted protein [Nematostella vectensis]|eukprot:XP_001626560.1 predicted protein [Nematostella vectensis]